MALLAALAFAPSLQAGIGGLGDPFGFVIRPLGAKADAAELARVSANETAPVLVTVDDIAAPKSP